jgi:hypothetical protein
MEARKITEGELCEFIQADESNKLEIQEAVAYCLVERVSYLNDPNGFYYEDTLWDVQQENDSFLICWAKKLKLVR